MWGGGFWFGQELGRGALQVVENSTRTAAGRDRGGPHTLTKLKIRLGGGVLFRDAVDMGSANDCGCLVWFTVFPER